MYFLFLWEVVKRAFTPTPRVTDMLQILAASALPAASRFIGIDLPQNAGESALAYIGLIAMSFVAIRLLWAPYALWKEQGAEIGAFKLELTRPERLILEHMAKLRAKARMRLSKRLHVMHLSAFDNDTENALLALAKHSNFAMRFAHKAGLPGQFTAALGVFDELCEERIYGRYNEFDKATGEPETRDFQALDLMQRYLLNEITIEDLERRLPKGIGEETPQ